MARPDPKRLTKLRDQAQEALTKGRPKRALELYLELAGLDDDPGWPHRAGELCRRLDRRDEAVALLARAAEGYVRLGFSVKALAVCKLVLEVDPANSAARGMIAAAAAPRAAGAGADSRELPVAGGKAAAPRHAPIDLPEAGTLDDIPLASVAPTRPVRAPTSGLREIALDDGEFDRAFATHVGQDTPPPPPPARPLPRIPLLSDLRADELATLLERCRVERRAAGEVVFRQGAPGDGLYVVVSGAVRVVREGAERLELGRLGEGAFFGEIALLTRMARSATVEAVADSELLVLGRELLGELIRRHPGVLPTLLRFLRDRLIELVLDTAPLFAPFGAEERRTLAARFRFIEAEPGAALIAEGERAPALFVLCAGGATVTRRRGDEALELARLVPGDLAGEMSLLTRGPAVATIRATSRAWLLELPDDAFQELILTHPQILIYVHDLADERRRRNAAIAAGRAPDVVALDAGHVDLG